MKDDKALSWVADARRLLQDFVTPEVRTLMARLDAMDKVAAERHSVILDMFQERDRTAAERDKVAAERHQALLDRIEGTRREIDSARRELLVQIELAITKSKLELLQAGTAQTAQPSQQQ